MSKYDIHPKLHIVILLADENRNPLCIRHLKLYPEHENNDYIVSKWCLSIASLDPILNRISLNLNKYLEAYTAVFK